MKMQEKLYASVKVEYLRMNDILPRLHEAAKTLKTNSKVVSVRLFGSLVRGDYVPGSDADVLIVLKQDTRRMIDRIPEYLDFFMDIPIAVEVFPYTENEIDKMKESGNLFIKEILDTGKEL